MIDAKEAQKQTLVVAGLDDIEKQIMESIKEGKSSVYVDVSAVDDNTVYSLMRYLKTLDYVCTSLNHGYNSVQEVQISW